MAAVIAAESGHGLAHDLEDFSESFHNLEALDGHGQSAGLAVSLGLAPVGVAEARGDELGEEAPGPAALTFAHSLIHGFGLAGLDTDLREAGLEFMGRHEGAGLRRAGRNREAALCRCHKCACS